MGLLHGRRDDRQGKRSVFGVSTALRIIQAVFLLAVVFATAQADATDEEPQIAKLAFCGSAENRDVSRR